MDLLVPSGLRKIVVTGLAWSFSVTTADISTPFAVRQSLRSSPAPSRPRKQRIPAFRPSFDAVTASFTPSPPGLREHDSAIYPTAETGSGSKPFMIQSTIAVPMHKSSSFFSMAFLCSGTYQAGCSFPTKPVATCGAFLAIAARASSIAFSFSLMASMNSLPLRTKTSLKY